MEELSKVGFNSECYGEDCFRNDPDKRLAGLSDCELKVLLLSVQLETERRALNKRVIKEQE